MCLQSVYLLIWIRKPFVKTLKIRIYWIISLLKNVKFNKGILDHFLEKNSQASSEVDEICTPLCAALYLCAHT